MRKAIAAVSGGFLGVLVLGAAACGTGSSGTGDGSSSTRAGGESSSSVSVSVGGGSGSTGSTGSRTASTAGSSSAAGGGSSSRAADAGTHVVADASAAADAAGDADLAAARALCVQIINQDRATLMPPSAALTEDTAEESCVDEQAQADYTANTAHSAFGHCKEEAQDECPDWGGTPSEIMTKCLAQMWAEGPPTAGQDNHWLNMSNAKYTKVACGFYQTPSGTWWATQDFWP